MIQVMACRALPGYHEKVISPHLYPISPVWPHPGGPDPVLGVSLEPLAHDLPLPAEGVVPRRQGLVVADIMAHPVIVARTQQSAGEILDVMTTHSIAGMPVINADGELAGIISQSDMMAHLAGGGDLTAAVGALMSPYICFATPDASIESAADLMVEHGIHRVVVLRSREVAGMVTSLDLLRAFRSS